MRVGPFGGTEQPVGVAAGKAVLEHPAPTGAGRHTDGTAMARSGVRGTSRVGARGGHPGALLNRIFSTRTLGLTGGLADDMAADYLSGLLIGSELGAATAIGADPGAGTGSGGDTHDNVAASGFVVIAAPGLGERYLTAAGLLGLRGTLAPPDCVVAGHLALLRHAS